MAPAHRRLALPSGPVIDEAQECAPTVLSELRLLSSVELDSRSILTVILSGDSRLKAKLESPELLPLASRVRSRLRAEPLSAAQASPTAWVISCGRRAIQSSA